MLTLQNFETQINSSILQRGKQYYREKAITWLEETEENKWQAEVEGTATYQVNVTLTSKSEISKYHCDCPYNGCTCKHAVAVFFALRAELKKPSREAFQVKAKKMYSRIYCNVSACPNFRILFAGTPPPTKI